MPLLSMRNIDKAFSGVPANADVSLDVEAGEIRALLGENGAGKTTLMNILYGIYSCDSGTIFWKGGKVRFDSPKKAIEAGIGMVHQHFMLVPTLSVAANVALGLKPPGYPFTDRRKLEVSVRELSRRYGLEIDPAALVSDLSVGQRQRVEILKLLYRNASLLILDEPTAVLTPAEIDSFFEVLRCLKREGHAVILITHRISEMLSVSDRITVLRGGSVAASVDTAAVDAESLSRLMIGRTLKTLRRSAGPARSASAVLEVRGLSAADHGVERLRGVGFSLRPGEILGVAGVDGNGQKELAECLLGLRRASAGTIALKGERIDALKTAERRRRGIAYVSDDRHGDGLVLDMDLCENYFLAFHDDKRFRNGPFVSRGRCASAAKAAIEGFSIKAGGPKAVVRLLSGGNQQKLVLARELADDPAVLVAFQPTRGLDVGATEFVGERLLERREAGCAVLLISTDLDELFSLSDRIAVLSRGRLTAPMENDGSVDATRLGLLMAGDAQGGMSCAS